MKILQIIQKPQLRGAEIFACQLSQELIQKGCSVDVVYLFSNDQFDLDFDLNFIPLNANPKRRLWDYSGYKRLRSIIVRGQYDIIQANAGDTLKYAVLSRFIFGWKGCLVFRNANRMGAFIRSRSQRLFNKWLLRQCDFIISVSDNSRQDLIRLYPAAKEKSATIPIGTYLFENIPSISVQHIQQEPIFVNVGSFVPEKNHVFLLDVFSLYHQRTGKGFLWLVGDGKLRGLLEKSVEQRGIKGRVIFWGYTKDAIGILKSATLFVMCSKIEGLPAVILEAMACDIPVVSSAVGGITEVIENNVTGVCIQEWSIELYVQRISQILNDADFKRQLTRQAKLKLLDKFTMEKISTAFFRQYQDLLPKIKFHEIQAC